MTIEERAELAVETFAAGKGNCTQSVLCAWEDKIPVDHDTLMKLGAGYGAGMGCMQATCGALIGAVMAAGSVTDGKGTPRTARSTVAANGTTNLAITAIVRNACACNSSILSLLLGGVESVVNNLAVTVVKL